jgi:succinoglycan biosynthesis protein ExoA
VRNHAGSAPARPAVDVLVSTFNEEGFIENCLDHVLAQTYEGDYRVWLVDGGSSDATVQLASKRAAKDSRLLVVADGTRLNLPEALNVGLALGEAPFVAKVDAHGYPERDFLERAVAAFEAAPGRVGCVGGRPEQVGLTPFGAALAAARRSRFGVGASEYASTSSVGEVDTVQCGVYLRSALVEAGSFDARMNYGEDEEVNWRLRRAGYAIVMDTSIRFRYYARPSWRAAFRQYRNYGRARVRVVQAHPDFARLHHAIPMTAVLGTSIVAVAALWWWLARWALLGILSAYSVGALISARKASTPEASTGRIAAAFTALHLGYGAGMVDEVARVLVGELRTGLRQLLRRPS